MIQAFLSLMNVYNSNLQSLPPKILVFGVFPSVVVIVILFYHKQGKRFVDSLPLLNITYINTVRIFVEITLYWLFLNKMLPKLMTFGGVNPDIVCGITAPFVAYFAFRKSKIKEKMILIWNIISLIILMNIVVLAILSAPSPLQKICFHQPNIAILYFPFVWLPTFIVPLIIFGHITAIRRLVKFISKIE